MENSIYKIGQKIETTLTSYELITAADFEVLDNKFYGFISEIIIENESIELPDGTTDKITRIYYYAVIIRTEIDRYMTFINGCQRMEYHKQETINFPLNRKFIGNDDCSQEFFFTAVDEFNFTHDISLLD